jgi:magnesium chelatase family protein
VVRVALSTIKRVYPAHCSIASTFNSMFRPSPPPIEGTAEAAARVGRARDAQAAREAGLNATLDLASLERFAAPDAPGAALLAKAAETLSLSARAYHRTLKVARTVADLDGSDGLRRIHVAEALSLKRQWASADQAGFARVS